MSGGRKKIVLGTRGSALALAQARLTQAALQKAHPGLEVETRVILTSGDEGVRKIEEAKQTPAGAKGLFTREIEQALLRGEIDLAVHSCKDLPGFMPEGLVLAAVLERAPTADVLVSRHAGGLGGLPQGARVGTSSVRRARQLLLARPDFRVEVIRGNVPTRLRKLREPGGPEAIVLAEAGLERLGYRLEAGALDDRGGVLHAEVLGLFPAIGQGAIALQCREEDAAFLAPLNHKPTWRAVRAERELMRLLDGDCDLPVGVRTAEEGGRLRLSVLLFGEVGEAPRRAEAEGPCEAPERVALAAFEALR